MIEVTEDIVNINDLSIHFEVSNSDIKEELLRFSNDRSLKVMTHFGSDIAIQRSLFNAILESYYYWDKKIICESYAKDNSSELIPFKRSNYVYYLFNEGVLIYIGQTVMIGGRVKDHQKDKDFDKVYCEEVDKDEVIMIERLCIYRHNPSLNAEEDTNKSILRRILETVNF